MTNAPSPENLPIERVCGLRPQIWLNIGPGFVREDVKALALSLGKGFLKEAITNTQQICLDLTRTRPDQLISFSARQEILKSILAEPKITSQLPELNKIRRQRNFLPKFDQALQAGRLAFAHEQEEEVYEERLREKVGENPLRQELRAFTQAYEAWLQATRLLDLPLLLRKAIHILESNENGGWPAHVTRPEEIWILSVENSESLEREFWDRIRRFVTVRQVKSVRRNLPPNQRRTDVASILWQRWHTLDDAAEGLGEAIIQDLEKDPHQDWHSYAVLIPDIPTVRRSLQRVILDKKIPLADPRDPTQLRWEESVKLALSPLEVVSSRFERHRVISYLSTWAITTKDDGALLPSWVQEINSRAIRTGLLSYSGGKLADAFVELQKLEQAFSGKRTCQQLAESHLEWLRKESTNAWVIKLFETTWQALIADLTQVEQHAGQHEKKAQLIFWLEKLKSRIWDSAPPPTPQKPAQGLQIYRLQQAPLLLRDSIKKLWIFGLPPHWLADNHVGDYWFTVREREVLASEFAVRAGAQIREERLEVLKSWILTSQSTLVYDAHYGPDGREKPSIHPILKELCASLGRDVPAQPQELGAHPRFLRSYAAIRPLQPQKVKLPSLLANQPSDQLTNGRKLEITASSIDRYSRCSFQALAYHRWNLKDLREPERDLWPDVRGTLLHDAVKRLLRSNQGGRFTLSPREALDLAWGDQSPRGLFKSVRIENYVKLKLNKILEKFCEKERSYLQKSGVVPISLDDQLLRLNYPEFSIVGQPDRIDQHPDGLFILDYKSSGATPHGAEMVEEGYRLQLAFYALAATQSVHFAKTPVIGAQWVELTRKGARNSGIFFKSHNGKEEGKLTEVQTRSKSLMAMSPEETWSLLADHLLSDAKAFINGEFAARPKTAQKEKECNQCRISDLCGAKRCLN